MKTEPVNALKALQHYDNMDTGCVHVDVELRPIVITAFKEGQSNPKIKQLEWVDDVLFTDIIVSDGFSFLFYMIDIIDNTLHIGDMSQSFNTLEEAKAFAQDNFEARVKECLTTE